jgi:putative acetyltransferase
MGSSPEGAILIRRAEPGDYEGFAAVFEGATAQSETLQMPYPSRESWKKRLAEPAPGDHLLVALIDGRMVGNAGLHPAHASPRRAHAANMGIAVHDDFQGRGVGKALMRAIIDFADQWTPYTRIELGVYADNARAIALYKRFGFEPEGTFRMHTLRNGEYVDTLCMARIRPRKT